MYSPLPVMNESHVCGRLFFICLRSVLSLTAVFPSNWTSTSRNFGPGLMSNVSRRSFGPAAIGAFSTSTEASL